VSALLALQNSPDDVAPTAPPGTVSPAFDPVELLEKADRDYTEAAENAHVARVEVEIKLAFYRGQQHRLRRHPRDWEGRQPDDRVEFETINLIRPTLRQEVALFTKNLPKISCLPRGTDVVRRYQAQQAERFVNGLATCDPEFAESLYDARLLASITGGAWHKTTWDPNKFTLGAPGAPTWEAISRLDAFPNPRAVNSRTIYRMYHQKLMPREVATELYPVDWEGKKIDPSEFDLSEARWPNFGDESQTPAMRGGRSIDTQPVRIVECWLKPSPRYPYGGFIAFTGKRIIALTLAADGTPSLPDGYWPWVLVTGLNKTPGRLIPDGLAHDLIPLQMTINRYASSMKEATMLSSQNWLLASNQANIQMDDLDDMSGTVIKYEQAFEPKWVQAPGVNQGTLQALERQMAYYDQVSTQLDAARGITNGENNAKLMAVQTELGSTIHSPDLTRWANSELAVMYKNTLSCVSANATEQHYLALLGPNSAPTFKAFDPEVFHPEYAFVYVPGFDAPQSREVQEAKIMEGATAGLFEDTPAAKRARLKMRWMSDEQDQVDPKSAHLERVRQEQILLVTQGVLPTLLDRDDDETHLDEDEPFSISAEFLALPPELQQAYLEHMQLHQQQLILKQQGYASQAATLGGGASAPGDVPPGQEEQRGAETPWSGGGEQPGSETTGDEFSASEIGAPGS